MDYFNNKPVSGKSMKKLTKDFLSKAKWYFSPSIDVAITLIPGVGLGKLIASDGEKTYHMPIDIDFLKECVRDNDKMKRIGQMLIEWLSKMHKSEV